MPDTENKGILIYAQITRENYIHTVFFELAGKAKELAQKLGGVEVNAVILTPPDMVQNFKEAFENRGINKVYCFEHENLREYNTEHYSKLIVNLVNRIKPEIFLIGATCQGRDLAPRISCALGTGLTADCTGLDINENGKLAATRPTFGGQLMATILCRKIPQMATVRPKVFKIDTQDNFVQTEIIKCPVDIELNTGRYKVLVFKKTVDNAINSLDFAEIIVAGGKGLKNKAGFDMLRQFAQKIGGTLAASRGAVEAGLAPASIQVGQTGKTVAPKLYIACGISGAIQHTVGMTGSEHIIAINNDENAPIFDIADTGIVGDVFEIIPDYLKL